MNHSFNRSPIVAALDIGTSKVCCIIARVTKEKRVSILGYGYNAAKGIKNGVVVKLPEKKFAEAYQKIALLNKRQGIFKRKLTSFDVRYDNRIVVDIDKSVEDLMLKR